MVLGSTVGEGEPTEICGMTVLPVMSAIVDGAQHVSDESTLGVGGASTVGSTAGGCGGAALPSSRCSSGFRFRQAIIDADLHHVHSQGEPLGLFELQFSRAACEGLSGIDHRLSQ